MKRAENACHHTARALFIRLSLERVRWLLPKGGGEKQVPMRFSSESEP